MIVNCIVQQADTLSLSGNIKQVNAVSFPDWSGFTAPVSYIIENSGSDE